MRVAMAREIAADGLVVVHRIPLDHRRGLHIRVQQADMHQRPRGQRRDGGGAAAKHRFMMVDVRCERSGKLDAPGVATFTRIPIAADNGMWR